MTGDNEILKALLLKHEGIRLKPYHCSAGKLTIGIGRNLDDKGITKAEANLMLENDIYNCVHEARHNFSFFDDLLGNRQDVIISMIFNMGITRLLKFKRFIAALRDEDYGLAAVEMLDSRWAQQVPSRANELAQMMKCPF